MSLFVINRYEGEKAEIKNEKSHLSELLKRIEERKRERITKNDRKTDANNSTNSGEPQKKTKKKKKKKHEIANNTENELSSNLNKKRKKEGEEIFNDEKAKKQEKDEKNEKQENNTKSTELKKTQKFNKSVDLNKSDEKDKKEAQTEFTVLGVRNMIKKKEVKRILPDWLANPNIISIDLNSGPKLDELNSILDKKLIEALKNNGINKLFPVQENTLTWLLKCNKERENGLWLRDTCVSAPTGSGKTLAYVLPIVQILQSRLVPKIRCLVVAPVQELAMQIYKVMVTYTSHANLRVALLSGASPFEQEQNYILKKSIRGEFVSLVDIIVATPGRLIDHILKTAGFSLEDLRFLVIDEADKSADWLEYLPEPHYKSPRLTLSNLRHCKAPAQKLLFSATLSQDPEKLCRLGLLHPVLFTSVLVSGKDDDVNLDEEVGDFIGRYASPEELREEAVECQAEFKPLALYELLMRNDEINKTLVFANSGENAHRLTLLLRSLLSGRGYEIGELSAQLSSKEREEILGKFVSGEVQILISSDALARGLDIPHVRLVISYDLPKHIKGYIHRAGRTGRAGKSGTAISILIPKQVGIFKQMLSNAHKTVPEIKKMELDSVAGEIGYVNHIENLKRVLDEEKKEYLLKVKSVKRIKIM